MFHLFSNLKPHRFCLVYALAMLLHEGSSAVAWKGDLSTISVAGWSLTDGSDRPVEPRFAEVAGRQVLVSGEGGLKLVGDSYAADSEVTVRFGMSPPAGATAKLAVSLAREGREALPVSIGAVGGIDALDCQVAGSPLTCQLRGVYQRSLNYPDRLRKLLEHEMTSYPGLAERWLSVRFVLHSETCEIYINDILVRTLTNADEKFADSGALQLAMSSNVQLLSITSRPVTNDALFQPVRIDSRLNAMRIDGASVLHETLPRPNGNAQISGVPFVFPEPDRRGNDHIDLGVSWLQSGYMEGDFPPQDDLLGGRWFGPLRENPTRIQFQIPTGRYNALHLVCAADGERDSVPVITAQFFHPGSGRPESFSTRVPLLTAKSAQAMRLPVKLDNSTSGSLYLVTIPVDPGALAAFEGFDTLDVEITKDVRYYRCYPDPCEFSVHAAGLPSSVHVYAMTLERPAVSVDLRPDAPEHVWVAPGSPSYTVRLHNLTDKPRRAQLTVATGDYYAKEKTSQSVAVEIPAGGDATRQFTLKLKRYGYHDVRLIVKDADNVWTEQRSLAYLHADTRERGDWQSGRGPIFGCWAATFHGYPPLEEQFRVMAAAGVEAAVAALPEPNKLFEDLKMTSFMLANSDIWITNDLMKYLDKPEEAEDFLLRSFRGQIGQPSAYSKPELFCFFAEPSLGQITCGIPPDYYGEDYKLSQSEQDRLDTYAKAFLLGAPIIKKHWPNAKFLLPWGDPIFPVYFLRTNKEVRDMVSGVGVDIPAFERLAETQIHQLAIHRCYMMREEFRKAGIKNPIFAMMEGPAVAAHPSSLTLKENADNSVRLHLLLYAEGIDQLFGGWGYECNDYYGEQHYGTGGDFNRTPFNTPRPVYAAMAAMTRHINRKNLDKWLPTGSLSVYALQFKHYRTGELTHVFWTVRGKRPVTLTVPANAAVTLYDQMDNATPLQVRNSKVTFTIDQSPCYVEGLTGDQKVTLGTPDHSDARPAPAYVKAKPAPKSWSASTFPLMSPSSRPPVPQVSRKLGNVGDGTWKLSAVEDQTYANNSYLMVARFPGKMSSSIAKAPPAQGARALAVHLGKQAKARKVMPYYTTLRPARPIVIPGKASHIGLWARGASDWGRVVYCLRDAKGERWISIGTKNDWNCDDTYSASFFCFDGWRYLRFELPGNSPYDQYRELGTTWWGHFGKGDGLVDLPLKLEKIIVERRTHAMYVNDPQPARPDDVLLGDLYAEYERPEDRTNDAIRLNRLRIPVPPGMPDLGNPIADLAKSGVAAPTIIAKITFPSQEADGTKCFVHFNPIPDAQSYDVWVSPYSDGRGAFKLGSAWKSPGQLITGLRQDTDFYVFVVYTDKDGQPSKPSKPLKIHLEDVFGMK
ncbi:MAG: hypothetical protein Q7T82_12965 [Armatimonadota bacterium]|nr:hypothetical protein [Armatimonadota bacterium]